MLVSSTSSILSRTSAPTMKTMMTAENSSTQKGRQNEPPATSRALPVQPKFKVAWEPHSSHPHIGLNVAKSIGISGTIQLPSWSCTQRDMDHSPETSSYRGPDRDTNGSQDISRSTKDRTRHCG